VRYSFTGALTEPRQVLPGGYLSWQDAASGHWWQEVWFGTDQPQFRDLGVIDQRANGNVRAVIDRNTMPGTMKAIARGRTKSEAAGITVAEISPATITRAAMWRERTSEILEGARKDSGDRAASTRRATPRIRK
jgi:hypothetical protein